MQEADPSASLYAEAIKEAERHKWIESQKHGRDMGVWAIRQWYRQYWPQYCRSKRLEHLEGRKRWREFGDDDFGQLHYLIIKGDALVNQILDLVFEGRENLNIIQWALGAGLPMDRVIDILVQLDVNRAHLDPDVH